MPDPVEGDERFDRPLGRDSGALLSSEEVRVLWDFVHGDIMSGPTRQRLKEYWGMCPRHSWAYAVVEIELWEAGAGARGGHQPFDLTVLYTDLLQTMAGRLRTGRRRGQVKALERHGQCVICADVRGGALAGILVTHAGMDLQQLTSEANEMRFTADWLTETRPMWAATVCPDCAEAHSVAAQPGTLPCRAHLLSGLAISDASVELTRTTLMELAGRVRALTDSMTQSGRPTTELVNASWVQAVSWFNGWDFPLTLTRSS
ncbi:hypothetical protein [Leifsonia sp. PS1209]|uniref:hypothetical protein n=1 Tax=Leifsonia sp. PS1209 TaxID=2724914 RepID=UPI001442E469|nr:hypothetical protein [Leifsonia sp. PS1209]QIZ99832.1 hypothetical protein HF024_15835 [Leifsonia sp. PS1209]